MPFQSVQISDVLQSRGFGHVVRWTIVLALWTLLVSMAIGKFGISNYLALLENAEILRENNMALALVNQNLEKEIAALEKSASARKLFLVKEAGLVPEGSIVLHLKDIPKHPAPPQSKPEIHQKTSLLATAEQNGI